VPVLGHVGERNGDRGERDRIEAEEETDREADGKRRQARLLERVAYGLDVHRVPGAY
jgi:hypothetical protein